MKYAIIRLKGQQFKVIEGDEVVVDYMGEEKPKAEVLMLKTDKLTTIGSPVVEKSNVKLSVISEEEKGKKLYISKFKAKSRYRKKVGFRPKFTRLKVEKID